MSYFISTTYSGPACGTPVQFSALSVANCSTYTTASSYRNCTLQTADAEVKLQRYTKTDCISADSAPAAARVAAPGLAFVGVELFNATGCEFPIVAATSFFPVDQCIAQSTSSSSKGYVSGNKLKNDQYSGLSCEGSVALSAEVSLNECNSLNGVFSRFTAHSANAGSTQKVSWGLVAAVVLSQLL